MTHFDEGLGDARNVFSTNLARIKNVYGLVERSLEQEAKEADAAMEASQREDQLIQDLGLVRVGLPIQGVDMTTFFEQHRDRTLGDLGAGREMAFKELMAALDGFFVWWRIEHGLGTEDGDWVPVASPKHIRVSIASLGLTLDLRPEIGRSLIELRERRNVLIHKNGVAGRRYCEATAQPNLLGQRLEVGQEYLSSAVDLIDHLTAALALIPHEGTYVNDADKLNRQRIVTQIFVRSAPVCGKRQTG